MPNWNELRDMVHETATKSGWHEKERPFEETICLFHCELSEAVEELLKGNPAVYVDADGQPHGYAVEMVDCIIRILDWMGEECVDASSISNVMLNDKLSLTQFVACAHYLISCAWTTPEKVIADDELRKTIGVLSAILQQDGHDVEALIRQKDEYNRKRSWRHG